MNIEHIYNLWQRRSRDERPTELDNYFSRPPLSRWL